MIKIAFDVMGFENDLKEAVCAAQEFVKDKNDLKITLVGDQNKINQYITPNEFDVVHTTEFCSQEDAVFSARRKANSSIQLCANLLRDESVDGILSACNSGVFVFVLYNTIGTLKGIEHIGFMPTIPKINGTYNMVDVGGSIDVDANDLLNYTILANEYAKQFKDEPVIKVLNIGTESHKGKTLQSEIHQLLSARNDLNYAGFIEPNKLLDHDADLVITDAFTGNIALKALEGTAKTIANALKTEFKKPRNWFKALLAKNTIKKVASKFDYKNNAGAIVLGLNQLAVKTHGSADKKQFLSSLRLLYGSIKFDVIKKMKAKFA